MGWELRKTGSYGEAELARIAALTTPGSRVLIVGAHVGALALPVARRVREVVAVEANPRSFELLGLNIALNRVDNCTPLNLVAAEKPGRVEFLLNTANSGGSKRRPLHGRSIYTYDRPEVVELEAAPLDRAIPEHEFDCILMDIEGSEYFALQGMPDILAHSRALLVEFIPHHLRNVAGVTADALLDLLAPHFDTLYIPSRELRTDMTEGRTVLKTMFEAGEEDEGILFEKREQRP